MQAKEQQRAEICVICGHRLRETSITHEEKRGTKFYLFQNVPAQICTKCGELWIEEATLREIDRLIQDGRPTGTVETPVYDLAIVVPK